MLVLIDNCFGVDKEQLYFNKENDNAEMGILVIKTKNQ